MDRKARWVRVSSLAGALLPLVAGFTSAASVRLTQDQTNPPIQQDRQVAPSPEQGSPALPQLEKAKDLIGAKVVNDKGEQLGTIKDVVLTPDRSAINYVVLSSGMADKYFAVPWSQFSLRPGEEKLFVLTGVSRADLDRAKGFDMDHWPATASANWLGIERNGGMMPSPSDEGTMAPQSRAYPGSENRGNSTPGTGQATDIRELRLSKILGMRVQDAQGEEVGRLDNVMIDLNQGKLAYGIVAMRHGFLRMDRDYAAVPWTAIDLTSRPGFAKVNADRDTLAAVAFNRDNFPNLADPQYSRQLFDRFHVAPYWESPSLGYVPGEENKNVNPPAGMTAPNSNAAASEMIAQMDKHALSYNPNSVETIHGTVKSVKSYRIEGTSTHGVLLTVRTDDGRTVMAQLGPRSWMDRQNIVLHPGDPVTITGSAVQTGHHVTLVAAQIQTARGTLNLRAPDGRPLWNLNPSGTANAAEPYSR
jgi:sporulation protein YlmC with PRC-barrel domain/translation initiation factor IF-1